LKKKTARKAAKPSKSFEETLWDTANKLRGSVESSDWNGATETTRQGCPEGEGGGVHQFYTMQNVFYLPETSRWSYIQQQAKQGDIALKIDSALTAVEKSNASHKGALPDNDYSRLGLDVSKFSVKLGGVLPQEIQTDLAA
jgi:type I restriction enzyme M protein